MKKWILILVALGVSGCSYHTDKPLASQSLASPEVVVNPPQENLNEPPINWFAKLQSEIFVPSCVKCHNGPDGAGDVDMSTYEGILQTIEINDPEHSILYLEVASGKMPKKAPKLSPEKIDSIKRWIEAGAPNS